MGRAIEVRTDRTSKEVRGLAKRAKDAGQARRTSGDRRGARRRVARGNGRLSPWRSAFLAVRARPLSVFGPVLACAFARLALILWSLVKPRRPLMNNIVRVVIRLV